MPGGSKSTTNFEVKEFPGLFDDPSNPTGQQIGQNLLNIGNDIVDLSPIDIPGEIPGFAVEDSPFFDPFQQELLNPTFGTSQAEERLLQELISRTGGQAALRGLGSPTPGAIAQTIAPQLANFRQQRLTNLGGALGGDINARLGIRGLDINQRGQTIAGNQAQESLRQSGQFGAIQLLIDLAQLSQPVRIGGTSSSSTSGSGIGSVLGQLAIAAALAAGTGGASAAAGVTPGQAAGFLSKFGVPIP